MRLPHVIGSLVAALVLTACSSASTPPAAAPAGSASPGADGCADVSAPAAKDSQIAEPSGTLDATKTYTVTMTTSCGEISIVLDAKDNPITANAFAHLVREKYYDQTRFHRVIPGFVVQGGDPDGNGTGGPPWKVVEAPAADTAYDKGVVAMAKAQNEAAGTSGSQFFIVPGDDAGLTPDYAVAGRVSAGQDVADRIAGLGTAGVDGGPSKPVVLETATLSES